MPRHVLNNVCVTQEGLNRGQRSVLPRALLDVPHANLGVIGARQQKAIKKRAPVEAVALLFVARAPDLRPARQIRGVALVLRVVEDQHVAVDRLGRDHERVVRAVARPVNLAVVRNLDGHLKLPGEAAEAAHLALLVVVRPCINLRILLRQAHARNHQEVGLAVGRVRAEDHLVLGIVLRLLLLLVGQPLARQRRPLQRVCHDQVIEERRVLLPDLVLLGDHALVLLVGVLLIVRAHRDTLLLLFLREGPPMAHARRRRCSSLVHATRVNVRLEPTVGPTE
mmetsp:Transcript_96161/g.233627  ORF Transcript_96161/g.233627 Transcript_96161/m.233627 type:complete len:281 (-) Transcript_96161:46-888(-)